MTKARTAILVALATTSIGCNRQSVAFDVRTYGDLLQQYAPDGKVAYAELRKNDWPRLENVYRSLASIDLKPFQSPEAELAFWMNAYNAIVLYSATKAYPVKKIWTEGGDFFKAKHPVAGRQLSLDEIEREMIREKSRDARVHFGVNCGSTSCPLLATQPYTAENLKAKLDLNARLFIGDEANVKFVAEKGVLEVSEIFKWYAEDFVRDAGSVEKFLEKYLATEKKTLLRSRQWKLNYIPYDWSLNAASLR